MTALSKNTGFQVELSNRQIIKMAAPISFAILIPQINFVTNNIFLGHYSKQALAIAGLTGVYYLIFSAIGYGLNNGLQALIARRAGENRPEEIGKLFSQAVFIGLSISLLGILITYTITPHLFGYFINDAERLQQAVSFCKIRIWGLPFLFVYQMRNALLVGTNQSKYLVGGALAEAVTNILLDYLLIFGKAGFPEMGLNGAAVSSIIAEITGLLVIYLVIMNKGIGKQLHLFKNFRWDAYNSRLIFAMSAPLVFQHGISIVSWEYFFLLIDAHGEIALGVSNTMRNILGLSGIVTWAFGSTTNAMVSNIIGQGRQDQVWVLIRKMIKLSLGSAIVIAILLNLFPDLLFSLYGQSGEFVAAAVPVVRVMSIAIIIMSFSVVFLNAVTGSGNSRVSLLIELFAIVLYCVYIYLVLDKFFLSITYGWMSEWLYWVCLFLPSFLYMRSGKWKNKVI
ncbi:MATE family efflux transporter [Longitalea luteola]|uniref:MATE family efflux transporter n=1 Tax=Longitalea luteola TaxID=2812563 RepID=UPI001A972CF4|nr:MATE family efflux transporter [Longitalea luteola]